MDHPIVFLGPTLSHHEARRLLPADYRPPIRRGDLAAVPDGALVGVVDGVFDQDLSVSPREIRTALARGVHILGSSSMGALRATEVPGMIGVGRVYEMFRTGALEDDDEVAITFEPETLRPLCEPMVNVRHAVERVAEPGTISHDVARAIVRAAKRLPYRDRTYPHILRSAGLASGPETQQLARMLASFDLKRDDAVSLLEELARLRAAGEARGSSPGRPPCAEPDPHRDPEAAARLAADAPVWCWEFGPPVPFAELVRFLTLTGDLPRHARSAVARFVLEGNRLRVDVRGGPSLEEIRDHVLERLTMQWRFGTEEETRVVLEDFGIGTESLESRLDEEVVALQRVMALVRRRSPEFLEALRVDLFLDDLALKRVTARAESLTWLAARASPAPSTPEELRDATRKVCQLLDRRDRGELLRVLGWWGIAEPELDGFLQTLSRARRAVREMAGARAACRAVPVEGVRLLLRRRPKAPGDRRFCVPLKKALAATKRLRRVVGITRVSIITGLADFGIPNASAFRPDGIWSSTIGSGKSETKAGARVGAVMEEVEKWAQEQYPRARLASPEVMASHDELTRTGRRAVDPRTLDLPHDATFDPAAPIGWRPCADLVSGESVLVPSAALTHARQPNDLFYSPRAGRKVFTTNGLASGFNLEEAITHALCEYVERHSVILSEILHGNPGAAPPPSLRMVDLETVPASTRRLVTRIRRASSHVRVFDLRADVRIPTFAAAVFDSVVADERLFGRTERLAMGKASHPDPEVALNMAILEAVQTVMGNVMGAREDITIRIRSLGRHERSASSTRAGYMALRSDDLPRIRFDSIEGLVARNARDDVQWAVEQVRDAGYGRVLVADYSVPEIRPVRVVRVIVPGFETTSPFRTGLQARAALLADLLPGVGREPA